MPDDTKLTRVMAKFCSYSTEEQVYWILTPFLPFSPNKRLFEEFPCSLSKWYQPPKTFFSAFPECPYKAESPTGLESGSQQKEETLQGSPRAPVWTGPWVPGHSLSFSTAMGRGEGSVSASGTHSCLNPNPYFPFKTKTKNKTKFAPHNPDQELWRH